MQPSAIGEKGERQPDPAEQHGDGQVLGIIRFQTPGDGKDSGPKRRVFGLGGPIWEAADEIGVRLGERFGADEIDSVVVIFADVRHCSPSPGIPGAGEENGH